MNLGFFVCLCSGPHSYLSREGAVLETLIEKKKKRVTMGAMIGSQTGTGANDAIMGCVINDADEPIHGFVADNVITWWGPSSASVHALPIDGTSSFQWRK